MALSIGDRLGVYEILAPGMFLHAGLAVSTDEEWILYAESSVETSELMLVESFG